MTARQPGQHSVACGDFFNYQDPEAEWVVTGFASAEAAREYARRFIRASIEHIRRSTTAPDALKDNYWSFGEYASAEGLDGTAWMDHCMSHPATAPDETAYAALDPRAERRRCD